METRNHKKFLLRKFFDEYMDLNRSKEDEQVTVDSIRNGVEFKGTNLWILIFATFIASLGLNVNSTAVIIGAMLISPLMGPIMGVGLAIGQNDFELMKRSLKSFMVATLFSVVTATLYFLFTPLDEVQSELLARTSPTIYDVLLRGICCISWGPSTCISSIPYLSAWLPSWESVSCTSSGNSLSTRNGRRW